MIDIITGVTQCPRYTEVKLLPCLILPPKIIIWDELMALCSSFTPPVNLGLKKVEYVPTEYLLVLLSSINSTNTNENLSSIFQPQIILRHGLKSLKDPKAAKL